MRKQLSQIFPKDFFNSLKAYAGYLLPSFQSMVEGGIGT